VDPVGLDLDQDDVVVIRTVPEPLPQLVVP